MLTRYYKNRNGSQEHENRAGGWQIVYTGFILILLCFFIMLTSFASLQKAKITQFVKSFSNAVSVFEGGQSIEKGETQINAEAMIIDKEDEIAKLFEKVNSLTQDNNLSQINIHRSAKGVVITLSDKLLFASGDAKLSTSSYELLERIATIIKKVKVPVEIEGHTDNVPIYTDKYPSNWELSTARAVNVLRFMTEKQKVDIYLISAVGMSQFHPVVPNSSMDNKSKNRRVEIVFKPQ